MAARRRRRDDEEELNLNKEDVENFKKAVKDEKFRELLKEYADEITDPKNVALYQKEITQLEKERGVDVTFLQPKPSYVIKTSMNGEKKAFINISSNENIAKPSCEQTSNAEGQRGLQWSIPYSLAPEKEDLDKERRYCVVYDVLFHPETLYLGTKNNRFKKLIEDTAMDGIEKNFNVKLDRKNIRHPRLKFKGVPIAAVMRKRDDSGPIKQTPDDIYRFPPQSKHDKIFEKDENPFELKAEDVTPVKQMADEGGKYTKPKFEVKYRDKVDLQDFAYQINGPKVVDNSPKEISVEIDLPLIPSATNLDLDVTECKLKLQSETPAAYLLELQFSYPVEQNAANAKFDSTKRKLFITLPIQTRNPSQVNVAKAENDENSNFETESALSNGDDAIDDDMGDGVSSIFTRKSDKKWEIENKVAFIESLDDDEDKICDTEIYTPSQTEIYSLFPSYEVKQTESELIFKLNAFNVDPESVIIKTEENEEKLFIVARLQCTSIGSGFVPCYYSFYVKTHGENKFKGLSDVKVDVEEENVIFRLGKHDGCHGDWQKISLGVDANHTEDISLITLPALLETLDELQADFDEEMKKDVCPVSVEVDQLNESCLELSIKSESEGNCELQANQKIKNKSDKPKTKKLVPSRRKTRSLSDSDELVDHKPRSILKTHRFGRSLSESSEDAVGISIDELKKPPPNSDEKIPEESSGDEESKERKSVRFNDVVSKNLYRSSSSILGQRRKNQRKQKLKKRAHQRRTSESEGSESDASNAKGEREAADKDGDESEKSDGAKSDEGDVSVLPVKDKEKLVELVKKGKKKGRGCKSQAKLIEDVTDEKVQKIEEIKIDEIETNDGVTEEKEKETILNWDEEEGGIVKVEK
uniref:Protein kintoun n=1 Tax=Strigamia maritima TaxID=126957 RepID=T1IP92_STRMM